MNTVKKGQVESKKKDNNGQKKDEQEISQQKQRRTGQKWNKICTKILPKQSRKIEFSSTLYYYANGQHSLIFNY